MLDWLHVIGWAFITTNCRILHRYQRKITGTYCYGLHVGLKLLVPLVSSVFANCVTLAFFVVVRANIVGNGTVNCFIVLCLFVDMYNATVCRRF